MALKSLIFFGLLVVALGFKLPAEHLDGSLSENASQINHAAGLVRQARSPQGRLNMDYGHSGRFGSSADIRYTHPLNNNFELYGGASRDFHRNDNKGYVGASFKF